MRLFLGNLVVLGYLAQFEGGETIELHEILNCFLTFLLEEVYLPTYKIGILELWILIDALIRSKQALVMLANFSLDY